MIRRIIQVTAQTADDSVVVALCNDGTLWGMGDTGQWVQYPAIPQNWDNESVEKQWAELQDARSMLSQFCDLMYDAGNEHRENKAVVHVANLTKKIIGAING